MLAVLVYYVQKSGREYYYPLEKLSMMLSSTNTWLFLTIFALAIFMRPAGDANTNLHPLLDAQHFK